MASTDVMHDPNWLIANMRGRGPHDPIRAQMEAQLHQLEFEKQQQMQGQQFNETQGARQDAERGRQTQTQNRQDDLNLYREGLAENRVNRREDTRSAQLNTLLSDQTTDPAIRQAIQNHLLGQAGVSVNMPADPTKAALARSKGLPEPQGTTVGAARGQTQGAAATGSLPVSPTGTQLNVDAGKVYGQPHPQGTDINTNTGEFVPSDLVGTINGKPSTQAVAEGALKTGHSPEDTRSGGVYNAMRSDPTLSANQPAPNENMVANPITPWSPSQLAGQPQVGAGALTTPPSTLGNFNLASNKPLNAGPQPNATPGPGAQQQGPFTAGANALAQPNAPLPPPSMTPPAIPPINKPTPEEERRRLLAGQQ